MKAFMPLHLPSESDNENILVLVQLFGGNDGLNTIVPLDIYRNYFNARKGLALQEKISCIYRDMSRWACTLH